MAREDGGTAEGARVPPERGRQTEEREHDQLVVEQERLQAGQEQLARLRAEQDEQAHRRAARRECRHCEYERADQERLAMQAQDKLLKPGCL